jgi:hypothetical protein
VEHRRRGPEQEQRPENAGIVAECCSGGKSAATTPSTTIADGYANLEDYLNELAGDIPPHGGAS